MPVEKVRIQIPYMPDNYRNKHHNHQNTILRKQELCKGETYLVPNTQISQPSFYN